MRPLTLGSHRLRNGGLHDPAVRDPGRNARAGERARHRTARGTVTGGTVTIVTLTSHGTGSARTSRSAPLTADA
jgi:hypothetical protein